MLLPEQTHRFRFPKIALLRASAADFGLGQQAKVSVCLGAIYTAVMAFAEEAEDGAFESIFAVYAQGMDRINVTVTAARNDVSRLVIEHLNVSGDKNVYLGGITSSAHSDGSAWNVGVAHLGGQSVTADTFLNSLSALQALELVTKDVSDRFVLTE